MCCVESFPNQERGLCESESNSSSKRSKIPKAKNRERAEERQRKWGRIEKEES